MKEFKMKGQLKTIVLMLFTFMLIGNIAFALPKDGPTPRPEECPTSDFTRPIQRTIAEGEVQTYTAHCTCTETNGSAVYGGNEIVPEYSYTESKEEGNYNCTRTNTASSVVYWCARDRWEDWTTTYGEWNCVEKPCADGRKVYTADDACSYTAKSCCQGTWCSGDITCPSCTDTTETRNCLGNVLHALSGTQTRARTVTSGACDSCTYGSWSSWKGICKCDSGYYWGGSLCVVQPSCTGHEDGTTGACCQLACYKSPDPGGECETDALSFCLMKGSCCRVRDSGGTSLGVFFMSRDASDCVGFAHLFNFTYTGDTVACY